MKMEILLEPTSNKLMVEHAEYDESNTYVLERFNTTAGNPVKKILLKLNLSDHRLFKDGGGVKEFQRSFRHSDTERLSRSDEVLKLKNFKKDATLKLFKSTNQVRYEHVGPTITSSQDGKVNKMAKRDYAWLMISRYQDRNALVLPIFYTGPRERNIDEVGGMHIFWNSMCVDVRITILKTNTPYPSRKIRRIRACTHQRPQRNKDQYAVSRENQYAVFKIWNQYNILEDIKRGPYSKKSPIRHHNLWDVIVNRDLEEEPVPTGDQSGASAPPAPKTAKQLAARRNQERVKSILLLAIPDEYLLKFQKLISQLEVHGAPISKEDINQKFLRSLPSSWNQIALIMRNKPDIDEIDIDDLYNNLGVYEDELKRSSGSNSASQNLAFLASENTSSTNEVSTVSGDFGVSTAGGINQVPYTLCAHDNFVAIGFAEDERQIKEMNEESKDPEKKRLKKRVVNEEDTSKVPAKQEATEQGTKKRKSGHVCHTP
ncbi:hypothetical protein Tco_0424092 [Tanacetum coccineum]